MSDQSAGAGDPEQVVADLLDPYEKLINVEIMGLEDRETEKNRLLR